MKKLRIARTGTTTATAMPVASNEVPSPSLDSMIEHITKPDAHGLHKQEAELQRRGPERRPYVPQAPPMVAPDLVGEIKKVRGK